MGDWVRALGIDFGKARIGLAISDDIGLLAHPLETVPAHDREGSIERIVEIVRLREIEDIVIGLPLHVNGEEGKAVRGVRRFSGQLRGKLPESIRWHEVGGKPGKRTLEQVRPFLHTHDNLIEYNEIHHVMEKMGDGNGIYIRGAGAGNMIRRNYIHHLVTPMLMQAAIRTDGGQRDTLITENLIYKCMAQGIILKLNNEFITLRY